MQNRTSWWLAGVGVGVAAMVACSSDSDSGANPGAGGSTGTGGAAGSGSGGASGGQGSGGDTEGAGGDVQGSGGDGGAAGGGLGGAAGGESDGDERQICNDDESRCVIVPEECGPLENYSNRSFGTSGADLANPGQGTLVFTFGGDDELGSNRNDSCLIAGQGDDTFNLYTEGSGEDVLLGGPGADRFRLEFPQQTDAHIGDFEPGVDAFVVSPGNYAIGEGASHDEFVAFIDDFDGENASVTSEGTRIVYDPATGAIWADTDGNLGVSSPVHLATLDNHASITVEKTDFSTAFVD